MIFNSYTFLLLFLPLTLLGFYLVGTRSIVALQPTEHGPIGHVRCPKGHLTATDFGRRFLEKQTQKRAACADHHTAPVRTAEAA